MTDQPNTVQAERARSRIAMAWDSDVGYAFRRSPVAMISAPTLRALVGVVSLGRAALSPPLNMEEKWFAPHVAYSIAKYGMSLCVLGMAGEFRKDGIAVNALWPRTTIATAAVKNLLGGDDMIRRSRKPEIMGDAAHAILTRPSREFTGNFCIDDEVLESAGITDLSGYAVEPGTDLMPDFFVEPRDW